MSLLLRFGTTVGALVVIALLLVPPGAAATGYTNSATPALGPSGQNNNTTLVLSSQPANLSSLFWGTTITPHSRLLPNEADLLNATGATTLVFPGAVAGDEYDPFTNTVWSTHNGTSSAALFTESQFVEWCRSFTPHCTAIFQVPGEIDNASLAASVVNYTEQTLGFHPAYWEIGNEPALWRHFRVPWGNWATNFTVAPTATQYANLVNQYIPVLRTADPNIRIIGLPGIGSGSQQPWVRDMVRVNGPNISGLAVHEYPAGNVTGNLTLNQFYATLHGISAIPNKVGLLRTWVDSQENNSNCPPPKCQISLFLTEIGSALSHHDYGPFSVAFPGALDMAAQITQAMVENLTSVDLYAAVLDTSNSWFSFTAQARPVYVLYSQVLSHLGSTEYPVHFLGNASFTPSLYGVATTASPTGGRSDLMVVNTNTNSSATFAPALPGYTAGTPVEVWYWNGTSITNVSVAAATPQPIPEFFPNGLPQNWTLPPQSLVLFESYPGGAVPVTFTEQGYPLSRTSFWYLDVNGTRTASNQTSVTLFLPSGGVYPVNAPNLAVGPLDRYAAFTSSAVVVANAPASYTVSFAHQWSLVVQASPANGGLVAPAPEWWNDTATLHLTAVPSPGYLFSHWSGWGPGSFNGTSPNATVSVNGYINEKAIFVLGFPINFTETGLPAGTPWGVTVEGNSSLTVAGSSVTREVPNNHTYAFQVQPVTGYRSKPTNSSVNVSGGPVTVNIAFSQIHVPPVPYPITFVESGLPSGTLWSVTMTRSIQTVSSTSSSLVFNETNGTWGFQVGPVAGFSATPVNGSVVVLGSSATIQVTYRPLYAVTFDESGLPGGTSWGVSLPRANQTLLSSNPSLAFAEINGTWAYQVLPVPGYKTTPVNSSVLVLGGPVTTQVSFSLINATEYPVSFQETGLASGTSWSITIPRTSQTLSSNTSTIVFLEPNSTWGFQVNAVLGYQAVPTNSSVIVQGAPAFVQVAFESYFAVTFEESGLPVGTTWGVTLTLPNVTVTSAAPSVQFEELSGSWGYHILTVVGYRSTPTNGSVNITNGPAVQSILFTPLVPPGTEYAANFTESGLPAGTLWAVQIAGVLYASASPTIVFQGYAVSYWFTVAAVPGFVPTPRSGTFVPGPTGVTVTLAFSAFAAPVVWNESGLAARLTWSVVVNGVAHSSTGGWATANLTNGSYSFAVVAPFGYTPSPASGSVTVTGARIEIAVLFARNLYGVTFTETGLPAGAAWHVRLSGSNSTTTASAVDFPAHLGNYTFGVVPPPGYTASPRNGTVSVTGSPVQVVVTFTPLARAPGVPSLWTLSQPAIGVVGLIALGSWGTFAGLGAIRRRRSGAKP